jgi:hypothetical protein
VRLKFETSVGPSVGSSLADYPRGYVFMEGKPVLAFDTLAVKTHNVRLDLEAGSNNIIFHNNYSEKVVTNGNGDPRILLVGVKLIGIENSD